MRLTSMTTLTSSIYTLRPAPEVLAFLRERAAWKRWLRGVVCLFLLLTGQLAYVTREVAPRPTQDASTDFAYASPFTQWQFACLPLLRAPPVLA